MAWRAASRAASGLGGLLVAAAVASPAAAASAGVEADAHRRAAARQAQGDPVLVAAFQRGCSPASAPRTAEQALQQLRQTETDHQAERAQPRPRADVLLRAVVLRGCAAFHATRLQPGTSYPVWWQSQVRIEAMRPAATGFEIQARAGTADGAVSDSRVTFSRGLHHACFVPTNSKGQAACVMVYTHPHGSRVDGWAEANEGPFVATFAGRVSATRVDLPAVEFRDLPVFAGVSPLR
jgi:hypothetical protein